MPAQTEKVHRAEVQDVPLRSEEKNNLAEETQLRGGRSEKAARKSRNDAYHGKDLAQDTKMGFPTIFSCRRVIVRVFLLQLIAWKATNAAPSPIIRFPGDDTPRTDKEVALVSLWCLFARKNTSPKTV